MNTKKHLNTGDIMKVKELKKLSNYPEDKKMEIIAEGLNSLSSHVNEICKSIDKLSNEETQRGYHILTNLCEEEASKFLMLIDYVRYPHSAYSLRDKHIKNFYNHFSRCAYVDVYHSRPATWKDVCDHIYLISPELFLDGPNDVDWIFRNRLIQNREQRMYVDYIEIDGKHFWAGPEDIESRQLSFSCRSSRIINLIKIMAEAGFASVESLKIIKNEWENFVLSPKTHWLEVEGKNRKIAINILERTEYEFSPSKFNDLVKDWNFPLQIELTEKKVEETDLKNMQCFYKNK